MPSLRRRKLTPREKVFVASLRYHGFRVLKHREAHKGVKWRKGYVVPSALEEDARGIDFWIKMPRTDTFVPVQITQRGVRLHRAYGHRAAHRLQHAICTAELRLAKKRSACRESGIVFLVVRDALGYHTTPALARSDIAALRRAISPRRRRR